MKAVVLRNDNQEFSRGIEDVGQGDVDRHDVVLGIEYSSLNYKDALAITNRSPVVRSWPMVVGIDGAGHVLQSGNSDLAPGSSALVTGWGLGETRWGCLGEEVHLRSGWPLPLPQNLPSRTAMAFGTAGLTAMLSIQAIEKHGVKPNDGPVLVTGAAGGVGGLAVMMLSDLGYEVTASTGRIADADYLISLGAASVIHRSELSEPGRPLQKERWSATVDSVGSFTLANACASTRYGGIVTACGLAQGMDFPASVAPFILRGVTLRGIDSVMATPDRRREAWDKVADLVNVDKLADMVREIDLEEVFDAAEELLAGRVRGRIVVRVKPT